MFNLIFKYFIKFPRIEKHYVSSLSKEEIIQRLHESTHTQASFFTRLFNRYSRAYRGKIKADSFEITKVIHYKNSFTPLIRGQIQSQMNGSSIRVTLTLQKSVQAFMFSWLSGVFGMGFLFLYIALTNKDEGFSPFILLGPVVMFAFGRTLIHWGFNRELDQILVHLRNLFEEPNP